MIWLIIAASILTYAAVGAWTFGYVAGLDGKGENPYSPGYTKDKYYGIGYYSNEEAAWVPAIFWPGALIYYLILKPLALSAYGRGVKTMHVRKVRVELQEKLRVELEQAERELEHEVQGHRRAGL